MRFKINIHKILLYIIMITLVAFAWNFMVNTEKLPSFFYLNSKNVNIENLMFYTWQVQVTIALISISLTSLIISNLETKIYGQSIKDILMITNKFQLTYIDKIILVILLSVINLWAIMYNSLPILVVIFIFSIIGVLDLILDSFNILFNPSEYEVKVKKYIDNNVRNLLEDKDNNINEIIKNIKSSSKVSIISGNIIEVDKNNKYLLHILGKIASGENDDINPIINSIEECIITNIELLKDNDYIEECIVTINDLLKQKFDDKYKSWMLEEGLTKLIDKANGNGSHQIYKRISQYLLYEIFKHINFKNINKSIMSSVLYRYFYWTYKNDIINNFVKREILLSFVNELVPSQFENFNEDEYKENYNIRKITIYKIAKMLIENNDKELFGELIKSIYNNNAFSLNLDEPNKNYEIVITISIFLYYIIVKEEACEESFKNTIKEFVYQKVKNGTKYDCNIKECVNKIGVYIWDSYKNIKAEMPRMGWEYTPSGAAKFMIMDSVIDEYFLFYSIVNIQYYEYEKYIHDSFNLDDCYKILSYYDKNGALKKNIVNSFKEYIKIYNKEIEYESLKESIKAIFISVNKLYVKLLIKQAKSYYEMEKVKYNIKKIKDKIVNDFKKSNKYIYLDFEEKNCENIKYINKNICTSILAEQVSLSGKSYEDTVISDVWEKILDTIESKAYKFYIKYEQDNKIKSLFNFIDNKKIEINSILNSYLSKSCHLNYNEKDEDIQKLQKFESKLNKIFIDDNVGSKIFLLREHNLNIMINIEDIYINDIKDKDIDKEIQKYKIDEDKYQVNILNDIFVTFTEKQIKEYFKYSYKVIGLSIKFNHNIKKNEIISIDYDKSYYL